VAIRKIPLMMHDDPLSGPDDAERGDRGDERDALDAPPPQGPPPDPLDRLWRHPTEMGRRVVERRPRPASDRPNTLLIASVAVGGSMVGALLTVGILALSGLLNGRPHPTANDRLVTKAANDATTQVVNSVRPSVVLVSARDGGTVREGAGVVIRHGGDILTSAWLVGRALQVTIETDDDKKMTATVVGTDVPSGLALLSAEGDLPAATLAAHAPAVGSSVIALSGDGNAMGQGIVNADNVVVTNSGGVTMANLFATKALPPLDDAGAPVIDGRAQVAGILLPHGVGAVPIDYARTVADLLREKGAVDHAWIGVAAANSKYGPIIRSVASGGPSDLAGMQRGDVVISVDGHAITSAADLQAEVRIHWPDQTLSIIVSRGGTSLPLEVTAAAAPAPPEPIASHEGDTTTTTLVSASIGS
jgi:S1-C subfamily serine protease